MGIMNVLAELEETKTTNEETPSQPRELPESAPEADAPRPVRRKPLRPEWILGIIAVAAALLLIAVLVMSRAYLPKPADPEDPEMLLHQQQETEEVPWPPLETWLEPTVPETEPETPPFLPTGIPMTGLTSSMTGTIT